MWSDNCSKRTKWTDSQKSIVDEINNITNEIGKKETELQFTTKQMVDYLDLREQFDNLSNNLILYQLYQQLTNYNGLPYQMLKSYLPIIEEKCNQILQSMSNFKIEIQYNDDTDKTKTTVRKSTIDNININICYNGIKPYNAQLASGFEKFIIGLVIRMVLCDISVTVKPDLFIIDEGWSCLDVDNLSNIYIIMNCIKNQYKHVMIISHFEELKNQADCIIGIDKINGYSCIKSFNNVRKKQIVKK